MSSLGPNEAEFARSLARLAANDPTLTHVNFNGWGIGDEGAGRLVLALGGNTVLTSLWLQRNGISAALVRALVNVLKNSTTLEVLNLGRNRFGAKGARAVARIFLNGSPLNKLNLRDCGIGVEGARALAEGGLPSNSSLTELYLSGNNIDGVGASFLARSLPGNSTLTALRLNDNGISDAGATALAEELPNNSSLEVLNLVGNGISDVGARLLAKALLVNSSVTWINLDENDISWALKRLVTNLGQISTRASNPQEALELKIEWLRNLDEGNLRLLGFEETGVEEEVRRLKIVCQVVWLINSGLDGEKEQAVTLALDQLEHVTQAEQRQRLFKRLLASPHHGKEVAESVNETTARTLYRYAAECGAAPVVLMNLLRAHESLCTCRDVRHKLYPFMLLATMSEAGVGDVMEVLKMDPTIVTSGIFQTVTDNKRKRESPMS